MRGQQLSGTRKLNKHWQSGTPGEKIVRLTGLVWPIVGFDLSGYIGNIPIDTTYYPHRSLFGKSDDNNIMAAQTYKIFDSNTTQMLSESDENVVVGIWTMNNTTSSHGIWKLGNKNIARVDSVHVWKYGKFRGEPHFTYYKRWNSAIANRFQDAVKWNIETVYSRQYLSYPNYENQNGVEVGTALNIGTLGHYYGKQPYQGNTYLFEDAYINKNIKVLVPYFEVIAMPLKTTSGGNSDVSILPFGDSVDLEFSNDITCIGNDFDTSMLQVIGYVESNFDGGEWMVKQQDNNIYISSANIDNGSVSTAFATSRSGFFSGDKMWNLARFPLGENQTPQYTQHGSPGHTDLLCAGTYQGDNMFYFWRLDHFECETINAPNSILPFGINFSDNG